MNKAQCKGCNDILHSKSVHDWVCCSCFKNEKSNTGIFIDGGDSYMRCGGNFENMLLYNEKTGLFERLKLGDEE